MFSNIKLRQYCETIRNNAPLWNLSLLKQNWSLILTANCDFKSSTHIQVTSSTDPKLLSRLIELENSVK